MKNSKKQPRTKKAPIRLRLGIVRGGKYRFTAVQEFTDLDSALRAVSVGAKAHAGKGLREVQLAVHL